MADNVRNVCLCRRPLAVAGWLNIHVKLTVMSAVVIYIVGITIISNDKCCLWPEMAICLSFGPSMIMAFVL